MNFLYRWFGVGMVICLGVLFWWYPAPAVFQLETPDWATAYETEYSPASSMLPSQALLQETLRRSRTFVPLHDYILDQLSQQPVKYLEPEQWNRLTNSEYVEPRRHLGMGGYAAVDMPALSDLEDGRGFLVLRDHTGIHSVRYLLVPAIDYGRHDVPVSLQFPNRVQAPLAAGAMVVGAAICFVLPVDHRFSRTSLAVPSAVFALLLALSLLMLSWPWVYGVVGHDAGFASMLIGFLLLLTSLVGLAVFGRQYAMLRRLFAGQNVLANWGFSPAQWLEYSQQRQRDARAAQTLLWAVVTGIGLMIIAIFAYEDGLERLLVPLLILALAAVIWRLLLQWIWTRRAQVDRDRPGEIILGYDGLYAAGDVHRWRGVGTRLLSAEVVVRPEDTGGQASGPGDVPTGAESSPATAQAVDAKQSTDASAVAATAGWDKPAAADLVLAYSVLSAYSMGGRGVPWFFWHDVVLQIPIPQGKTGEARYAAALLRDHYRL